MPTKAKRGHVTCPMLPGYKEIGPGFEPRLWRLHPEHLHCPAPPGREQPHFTDEVAEAQRPCGLAEATG